MKTLVGIAMLTTVGSSISFFSCCLGRGGLGIPATWQASTGTVRNENGSPSATTVALPMKISSLVSGIFGANGNPGGMWTALPEVPATARFMPHTVTVAPRMGT